MGGNRDIQLHKYLENSPACNYINGSYTRLKVTASKYILSTLFPSAL